jgi:hypothetical protein
MRERDQMNERDLIRLLDSYADELSDDELQATVPPELRERLRAHVNREMIGDRRILRLALPSFMGIAACAAVIALMLMPREQALTIQRFVVTAERVRAAATNRGKLQLGLELNRPGYVRLVAFDDRHERRLVPLDDAGELTRLVRRTTVRLDHAAGPHQPAQPAETLFVMVIASPHSSPAPSDLLRSIPERVPGQPADLDGYERALERIKSDLESRFDCRVRIEALHTAPRPSKLRSHTD